MVSAAQGEHKCVAHQQLNTYCLPHSIYAYSDIGVDELTGGGGNHIGTHVVGPYPVGRTYLSQSSEHLAGYVCAIHRFGVDIFHISYCCLYVAYIGAPHTLDFRHPHRHPAFPATTWQLAFLGILPFLDMVDV